MVADLIVPWGVLHGVVAPNPDFPAISLLRPGDPAAGPAGLPRKGPADGYRLSRTLGLSNGAGLTLAANLLSGGASVWNASCLSVVDERRTACGICLERFARRDCVFAPPQFSCGFVVRLSWA